MGFNDNAWAKHIDHEELKPLQIFKFYPSSYHDAWICICHQATKDTPVIFGYASLNAFIRKRFTVQEFSHNDRVYITE